MQIQPLDIPCVLLAGASLLALPLPSSSALAQDGEVAMMDEIIVTTRLRAENVLEVPVSITALTAETLARAEINDLQDLTFLVPGLVSSSPFGRINASPSIRGIVNAGLGQEQPVAFFVDGVYISGRTGLNGTFLGLERIEGAKGPQSALFGRNAFSGAVNLITRRPGDRVEGEAEGTLGTDDLYELRGYISGPLVPGVLAVGLHGLRRDFGGYFQNNVPGGPSVGSNETTGGMLNAVWTPSDDIEAYFKVLYTDEADGAPPHYLAPANSQPDSRNGFPRYFTGTLPDNTVGYFTNPEHQGVERKTLRTSLNLDIVLANDLLLQSLTGYNTEEGFYDFDADYTALYFNRTFEEFEKFDISQDVRLSGTSDTIDWLLGASYYYFDDDLLGRSHLPGFGQPLPAGALTEQTTDTYSVYGSIEVRPTELWSVVAEARWQREKKTYRSDVPSESGDALDLQDRWNVFLPRLTFSAFLRDDTMVYASIAKGFKTGGFNTFASLFDAERTYEPENNWTYELGAKSAFLNRRANVSLAAFWIDWSNQHVIGLSERAPSNNQFTTNAAKSRSTGIELEANYNDNGWTFNLGYALTDAKFRDYNDLDLLFVPLDTDVSGNRINRTSRHQVNLTGQYEAPLIRWDNLHWFIRADFAYQSSQFSVPANLARTGGVSTVNARVGLEGDRFGAAIWAKNLLNDETPLVGVRWFDATGTYTGLPPFQRAWLITAREGATFGLSLTYKFGS